METLETIGSTGGVTMTIRGTVTLGGVKIGDSICVNGACLTVTSLTDRTFTFGLAPETLRRTNLGTLRTGENVNLERSMAADGRFGGHIMQGHVDCTGMILKTEEEKDSLWFTVQIPNDFIRFLVEKGYITVDGTSLTVCSVNDDDNTFSFMMIDHTQKCVVTAKKRMNEIVNIEVDITAKYIERMMKYR